MSRKTWVTFHLFVSSLPWVFFYLCSSSYGVSASVLHFLSVQNKSINSSNVLIFSNILFTCFITFAFFIFIYLFIYLFLFIYFFLICSRTMYLVSLLTSVVLFFPSPVLSDSANLNYKYTITTLPFVITHILLHYHIAFFILYYVFHNYMNY